MNIPELTQGRTRRIVIGVILGVLGLCVLAYGADYLLTKGKVPRGTTVAGVSIGGMSNADARALLEKELGTRLTDPVKVAAGDMNTTVNPTDAGLQVDWVSTIRAAGSPPLNPIVKITSFFTEHEVGIVSTTGPTFTASMDATQAALTRQPTDGGVVLEHGKATPVPPTNGQGIDRDTLNKAVTTGWLSPNGVNIDADVVKPAVQQDAVDKVLDGDAKKALSGAVVARGRDNTRGVIPPERMGEVVTFVPDGSSLKTEVNVEAARAILTEGLGPTEKQRRNADIKFSGASRSVTPSVDGVRIDWDLLLKDLPGRIIGDQPREFDVAYIDEPATFTTEQAEKATFDQVVGEFTTGGFAEASGVNIRKTAEIVNGAMVAPGDTFSLNGYTGPRGAAQGFVESGIILNGRADKAVGGGISQFATTLYNAAYFAGMEDVAHTPHSYYISRYPAGREATVYEGAIDLKFKNTSQYPVLISTSADDKNVTVKLMGVKTVNVESVSGGRWAQTQPNTVNLSGNDCTPSSGAPGFTTSDTRIVKGLDGREISRDTTTTVYDPSPIVKCNK
ncbi:Vancomycin B-type resistance protein VanW [Corynebacterium durum]|nr:VanW family protein [Corynebacterium durum]NYI74476.1 vancomycin resistance protein YoaR [Corynebacterium durum]WJY86193.1 Vancomycin B-type resistance protein VanW [Corynebacterium durum]